MLGNSPRYRDFGNFLRRPVKTENLTIECSEIPWLFILPNFREKLYLGYVIPYHKSNLVYTVVFPQFLIFLKNNSAET